LKRGDLVIHAGPGEYGKKPRPALVIQSDRLIGSDSVLLCLLTSDEDAPPSLRRIAVAPTQANGLQVPSQIMVEKIIAAKRSKCGKVVGRLEPDTMARVDAALALVIGLAD
jgi:mRNA interferase MazF